MELETLGLIAEVGGGLATVITLIYVAVQVRENTASSKRAALDNYIDQIGRWMSSLRESPDTLRIFLEGNTDFNNFSSEDKFRYHLVMGEFLAYCESALGHAEADSLKQQTIDRTKEQIVRMLHGHGAKQRWTGYGRKTVASDFANVVDGLLKER